ncbi:transferrin receptor-like dimerization domain-containing protein [Foetidibacter luteolus]|uniref:transferrin receptor-like dimerization domain-containing protein n=1 Tax=Foetidibacter luteolus TaxID=2608880 RepID=UPI001A981905|nr:transferrin receptor-like dimerization domain-containing protein [Foetidibacter luteolus]
MMKNALLAAVVLFGYANLTAQKPITGFTEKSSAEQLQTETKFDQGLSAENIGQTIKTFSARPHHLGSAGSKEYAELAMNRLKSYGFDARVETYTVLFPTPKTRVLEMTGPVAYKALLKEPALKEDATSGQDGQLPTYNAWSADGDVTAELVFVNYGLPSDYDELAKIGVDVKGKIVIAKYGRSWRGIKPKVAQEHGAVGCIIYSDPKDDGYTQGDVYPKGAFKNEYGVQRGSVMDMPVYPGDPLTPGIGATENAQRLTRQQATNLLKIPVLPISYHDARPLLEALGGEVAPVDWQGTLPITYHIGPGIAKVHLKLEFDWKMVPCHNVIGMVKGSQYPDEWVIRGNHHDAWVNGASDPISGLAALLEEAKSIGELLKTGWKPKRTLVYCGWDGEEPALIGSTEWVEDHAEELKQKTVVYINSDGNERGFLGAGGSHALTTLMDEIAKNVTDPQTNVSVFERAKAASVAGAAAGKAKKDALAKTGLELSALGSGSDYSPFFQHLGIPSLNLGFGGEGDGGEYHSIYDSYDDYRRFKDPTFAYGVALAKTAGHAALRMANADVLPFDFRTLYKTVIKYVADLQAATDNLREATAAENEALKQNAYTLAADPTRPFTAPKPKDEVPYLDFSPLQNALVNLQKSADSLAIVWGKALASGANTAVLNKALYQAEQQLLLEKGLPRRGWYRHSLYAPGFYTGYGVKTMPGIREAIEQYNFKEAQEQLMLDAAAINRFAAYLLAATK